LSQSIRIRFAASLVANTLRAGISFATGLLLARWLGPTDYGRMAFLLASFVAFRQLLDMGSSTAFFTFLSQRPRSRRFITLYWRWLGLLLVLTAGVIEFLLPDSLLERLWKGESRTLVLLAFVAAFMQSSAWLIASQMAEADRQTVRVQRLGAAAVGVYCTAVIALWLVGNLTIATLFVALAVIWALASRVAARLYRSQPDPGASSAVSTDTAGTIWREFWRYCLPFVPYAWLGFAHDFANRWMLQHWGGAVEQAYYAVAAQFSAVALLATTSVLQILWKEIAEAHHREDRARVEMLYRRACRALYFLGVAAACGLLPWSMDILRLTVGNGYTGGAAALGLMFLYIAHQSVGQISGTMLYATGQTRVQMMVGIGGMLASLLGAYFTMAPGSAPIPGLGLGSRGLAYELVVVQIVQVNLQVWAISRVFGWKYDWSYQIAALALAAPIGWCVRFCVLALFGMPGWTTMIIALSVHLAFVGGALYLMPRLAGLDQSEFLAIARGPMQWLCMTLAWKKQPPAGQA
jgi:O-antigen/teichoic acid export membrane protein